MVPEIKRQKSLQRISELCSWVVQTIKNQNAMGLLDINLISEDFLVPLLKEIYGYEELVNLNLLGGNFPGIDLGDETAKVAIQVTSNASSTKISDTLEKFVQYQQYKQYDHLIVYIITEKQQSYAGKGWPDLVAGRFKFNKDVDIRDYSDLLKAIRHLPLKRIRAIETVLENNFGGGRLENDKSEEKIHPEKTPYPSGYLQNFQYLEPKLVEVAVNGEESIVIAEHAILAEEYAVFLRGNPAHPRLSVNVGWSGQNPLDWAVGKPVIGVKFSDALAYCLWLSHAAGSRFRLPTVAEWELGFQSGKIEVAEDLAEWTSTPEGSGEKFDLLGNSAANRMLCKADKSDRKGNGEVKCFAFMTNLTAPTFSFRVVLGVR